MISHFFSVVFYIPLYNGLIALFDLIPFADAGVVIILFTIIVKLILFPLSMKATKSQMEMKMIEPELKAIKEKYGDNKEEETKRTLDIYKKYNINPFAGIFVLLIQLPIIITLYRVFIKSGLPSVDVSKLYSFVHVPANINMMFLHMVDIAGKSIVLALIAGITSYFQIKYSTPEVAPKDPNKASSTTDDVMRIMAVQSKYIFPVMMTYISYIISGAVAIYLITSNLFTIGQEMYTRRHLKKGKI